MPSLVARALEVNLTNGTPSQLTVLHERFTPMTVGVPPMTPNAAMPVTYRNLALPDPLVGGYAEQGLSEGRTIDPGMVVREYTMLGQGHYDLVPTWNNATVVGQGTPNRHNASLRAGYMNNVSGYNPPQAVSASTYIQALTGGRVVENG